MAVELINPSSQLPLREQDAGLVDARGGRFPIVRDVPRICPAENYADNFGLQWNKFKETQIDQGELTASRERLFATAGWHPDDLAAKDVLEVGSGAGRFTRVLLERTDARIWSVDYSSAVDANLQNNGRIAPERLHLFQASIYELPFREGSFDKVLCLGVLQHTPDFERSIAALVSQAKRGGEIVVDFYPVRGFWTKLHAKYLLRPITRRLPHDLLLRMIEANAGWLIKVSQALGRVGLAPLTRFLPLVDLRTLPGGLSPSELREWAVLDTFDMFSPEHDHPQRVSAVARMFERHGADVTFAGFIDNGTNRSAVVRAVRR
jgi:SAM-dependent methyltransferase